MPGRLAVLQRYRERTVIAMRCRAMLANLDLPARFTVAGFCRAVEVFTDRPIVLHPRPPGWGPVGVCGVLASTPTADHVLFTADGSRIGQATTIVHECGHILSQHPQPLESGPGVALLGPLLQDIVDPGEVTLVRGRTSFSDFEERTVETFASMVLQSGMAGALGEAGTPGARLADRFG